MRLRTLNTSVPRIITGLCLCALLVFVYATCFDNSYLSSLVDSRARIIKSRERINRLYEIRNALIEAEKKHGKVVFAVNADQEKEFSWRITILPYLGKNNMYRYALKGVRNEDTVQYLNDFSFYDPLNASRQARGYSALVAVGKGPLSVKIKHLDKPEKAGRQKIRHPLVVDLGRPAIRWWHSGDFSVAELKKMSQEHPAKEISILWDDGSVTEGPIGKELSAATDWGKKNNQN